jgi:magnesium transporter
MVIQRQVFTRAVEELVPAVEGENGLRTYYRDVGDHLWRAIDEIEAARDSLQGMLDTYSNEVQERLTIVATVFLPLTVLTGFFGMNFNWLISHIGAPWAFWGIGIGGLLVSASGITLWLRRSGLYHGTRRD